MNVLVTGASGYIGARLVPELLKRNHRVRATFSRDVTRAQSFWWGPQVDAVKMDVLNPRDVREAMQGMDAVYYLVHGMAKADFMQKDRQSARIVAEEAKAAGVQRIVYLTGLVPPVALTDLSDHISSRLEVEMILRASGVPTLALRAAIIIGAGSTSFEIVRQISERLPIQTVPTWMNSDVQPIAVVDALEALLRAIEVAPRTRSYDIGGTERMSYAKLLRLYARISGLQRPQMPLPLVPDRVVGMLAGMFTDVPSSTVESLIESLHHDMVCAETDFRRDLMPTGYRMMGLEQAITRALTRAPRESDPADLDPMGSWPSDPAWAGGRIDLVGGRPMRDDSGLGGLLLGPETS
ncbi:NAD(P)H-binding protein [Gephyromycinifex aptenodytis]|uniref:NAD(P)H-binding protein n=1 Tax=Gephyromycinifex aptenodytis TaxID=2716227 RepID=UPI001447C78C|nr:NAD(P)H-binding protein [Gephyromycinifex aptenodytis]